MPQILQQLLQSETVAALIVAVIIFLITILLVVKQWIGFSVTFLLLVFALAAGIVVKNQHALESYFERHNVHSTTFEGHQDAFQKQMIEAVEDLKTELHAEKEKLSKVMDQIQEILTRIEAQKQKLQAFIEETREKFANDDAQKKELQAIQ